MYAESFINDRRNFYRLLYAQPDASLTVIKANHRILIQKLKIHPDRNFSDVQMDILNTAYTLLKDPIQRAAYDRKLQKRYSINVLSLGSFASGKAKNFTECKEKPINRRNYYRVLQIQPDAPEEIVVASYHALKQYLHQDSNLLHEAYTVLVNPAARMRYDVYLADSLKFAETKLVPMGNAQDRSGINVTNQAIMPIDGAPSTSHCIFCHAAYTKQLSPYPDNKCQVCGSPLQIAIDEQNNQQSRSNIRISKQNEIEFYLFWPDTSYKGILQDLSPRGARFLSKVPLAACDIMKIDASNFRAVAEVAHLQTEQSHVSVGVRFLTIEFEQERGNFLAVSA